MIDRSCISVIVIHIDDKWFTFSIPNYIIYHGFPLGEAGGDIFFNISMIRISHFNFYVGQIKIFEIILKNPHK